jgi:dTDP-4-amino-4,6-dideoxygalactose transaminase
MSRDAWRRYDKRGQWYYEILRHGFKYNQNDLLAALGRAQLKRFPQMQKARARAAAWYDRFLAEIDEVIPAPRQDGSTHAWHLYIIRLRGKAAARRDAVINRLGRAGIGTSVHFIPLCLQPYWRRTFKLKAGDFPHAVRAYRGAISLPMHPGLTQAQCRYVAESLKRALVRA